MSTDTTESTTPVPRGRVRPHHLVIGLGVLFAAITVASGIAGGLEGWEDDSAITRHVFRGGVAWAILRRYVQRPYRIRIKTRPEHAIILGIFALIGVSGFVTEIFR